MSLKYKYITIVALIHLVLVIVVYHVLKDNLWWFIASEFLLLLSILLCVQLYKKLIRPIDLMKSGTDALRNADYTVQYLKTGSPEVDNLISVFNTMIEKLKSERVSTAEQGYFVQRMLDVSPLATIIFDFDARISMANRSAQQLLNLPRNYQGYSLGKFESPIIEAVLQQMDNTEPFVVALDGNNKYKCQIGDVVHQGFKRKYLMIDDLSKQILQSEKIAYGKIIRMMAHEVNNSIGAINSILDTVKSVGLSEEDEDLKDSLQIAMDRNQGLCDFVDRFASVLRLPKPILRPAPLNDILMKCHQLYALKAKEIGVNIELDLAKSSPVINLDATLMEQAISNILKNAIESPGASHIIISTSAAPIGFQIKDNGAGISADQESKLFTPFYSTKPTGQGVGLMLIREVLLQHNAKFSLKTDQSTGWTSFVVEF